MVEYKQQRKQDGWRIEIITDFSCVACLVGEVEEDSDIYGGKLNKQDKMISIRNVEITANDDECTMDGHGE